MRDNRRADSRREAGGAAVRNDDGRSRPASLNAKKLSVAIAALVVVVDQLSKAWAEVVLADGPMVLIEDFLQFRLTYNTGAAFSMFSSGGPILAVIAVGVIAMIMFVLKDASHRAEAIGLGMVLGGSIGNFTDRLFRGDALLDGAVVDFIDFSFFATFNVADMGITLGVGLLLVVAFILRP